jgi:hypothetical protein
MKFASATLVLWVAMGTWAQDARKPVEPEAVSTVYYLDSSAQIVPLEHQTIRTEHEYRALGFAGGTNVYLAEGERSPVRIKVAGTLQFVVRLQAGIDPLETVQFHGFDRKHDSRVVLINQFNALGQPSGPIVNSGAVDFNSARYGTSSFRLIPVRPIVPGEYCLFIKPPNKWPKRSPGFCFGVDPGGIIAGASPASPEEEKTGEPEYFSVFYYLQTPTQFIELERQIAEVTGKGNKFVHVIPGEKSPVRLNSNSKVQFVVHTAEDFDKAKATMQLFRLEVRNGERQLLVDERALNPKAGSLKLNAERYASSSLKLSPVHELAPGEYCLSRTTISQGFCFGIDAPGRVGP